MLNGSDFGSEVGIAEAGMRTVCKNGSSSAISKSVLSLASDFALAAGFETDPGIRIVCIKGSASASASGSGSDFFSTLVFNGWRAGVVSIKDSASGSGIGSGTRLASGTGISASVGSA